MELCYTTNKALRDKKCPKAFYRDNWRGYLSTGATKVYTDMQLVRDAYENAKIEVVWLGRKKRSPNKAKKNDELRNDSGS